MTQVTTPKAVCKRCKGKGIYKCGGCGGIMKPCYPECRRAAAAPANRSRTAPMNKVAGAPIVKTASNGVRTVILNGVPTEVKMPHRR